jgi:hypothetical protein
MEGRPVKWYVKALRVRNTMAGQRLCMHLSHRIKMPCWRSAVYDGFCAVHNRRCWARHG